MISSIFSVKSEETSLKVCVSVYGWGRISVNYIKMEKIWNSRWENEIIKLLLGITKESSEVKSHKFKIRLIRDSPGCPAVKTSPFNTEGTVSIPDQGAKLPHASQSKKPEHTQ